MQRFTREHRKMKITTRQVALLAIFAALFFVLSFITPYIPALGVPEIKISLEALIATVFGLILGPYLGAAAALLGALISWTFTGMVPYNLPFLLSPPLNALVSGLIFYRKWKWGFAVFGVLIIAFLFTPPVTPLTDYWFVALAVLFDKVIALLLILPLVIFSKQFAAAKAAAFFFILAFVGNQVDNMWGSFVFATPMVYSGVFGMDVAAVRGLFLLSPFVYPAIRLIQAFIVTLIMVPLMQTLKGTPWLWSKETILNQDTTIDQNKTATAFSIKHTIKRLFTFSRQL
jgi:predicted membrane protein